MPRQSGNTAGFKFFGGKDFRFGITEMGTKLKDFDKGQETWQRFVQRVELYFTTAGIQDNADNAPKRRAILLQGMGIELYNKFCDSAGDAIANMTFNEIVTAVGALVNPAPMEIQERYLFHSRMQETGETATDFLVGLRKLALNCNFPAEDGQDKVQSRISGH